MKRNSISQKILSAPYAHEPRSTQRVCFYVEIWVCDYFGDYFQKVTSVSYVKEGYWISTKIMQLRTPIYVCLPYWWASNLGLFTKISSVSHLKALDYTDKFKKLSYVLLLGSNNLQRKHKLLDGSGEHSSSYYSH